MAESLIEQAAAELGMKIHFAIDGIYVKSPKGHWRMTQRGDGKWRLYHENFSYGCNPKNRGYHKHKEIYPDPINCLNYIRVHDIARYSAHENRLATA